MGLFEGLQPIINCAVMADCAVEFGAAVIRPSSRLVRLLGIVSFSDVSWELLWP